MAKAKNEKNTQAKHNDKLKILNTLRTCKVVLHNIALNKDLIQLYQLHFSKKKTKLEHLSSCINTAKNSSNNIWMLKENIQDNTEEETFRLTRSRSKKLIEKINKECKNVEFLDNVSYSHKINQPKEPITQKQQLKHDISIKSFSSKSNDEMSDAFSHTCCSHTQKKIISINNEKHHSSKRPNNIQKEGRLGCKKKLQFNKSGTSMESMKIDSDNENYLNENNLNDTDCDSNMQETSSESIKKYNNNLCTISSVINGTVCNVRSEQCEKNRNSKETSEDIKTDLKSKNANFSDNLFTVYNTINKTQDAKRSSNKTTTLGIDNIQATSISKSFSLNIIPITVTKISDVNETSGFFTTHNKQCANKTNNKRIIRKNLPKITGNHILPKDMIKIIKINTNDKSSVSNDTDNSIKQVSHINTLKSTNILTEKDYDTSKIDSSVDILKISEASSAFNNNINLKNKGIDNNEHHSLKINKNIDSIEIRHNVHNVNINDTDSITTEIYENCILNCQKRLTRLSNSEKHKNNILQDNKQDKKCKKINSDENIVNKNSSKLDVSENYNITRSLILVNQKEIIKQNRKRIAAEENTVKLDNKKKKLNRTLWLQNNITHTKLLNPQELDFSNIDTTVESNISEENIPIQKMDLREHLNKKRSKSPKLSTFENKFHNKTSIKSKQIDLNNKNDIITPTNTMTNEENLHKKLSFEKESIFNKTLHKEKDIQTDSICNNHMHSMLQSTSEKMQHLSQIDRSIYENTNKQEEYTNSRNEDDDDCISLFAESFDTNLCENTFLCEQDKLNKSLHSDVPYIMTASSFNKYMKQNATEFNKEYAKCVEDNIETSNKINKTDKKEFNNQSRQITHTDIPETRISKVTALETKNMEVSKCQWLEKINLKNFLNGYCFMILKKGICYKQPLCKFKHELQNLLNTVCSKDSTQMINIVQDALCLGYNFFCRTIYITSLQKLTVDQILIIYKIFHDSCIKEEMTLSSKRYIIHNIIKELLNRQLSLKMIVNHLVEYIPIKDSINLMNILECIEKYIKHGEYWNTVRTLVLRLPPDKCIIEKVLYDCIENKKLFDAQDVNNNLITNIPSILISILDKNILERFKSLLIEKTANNSHSMVQNFGESLPETIASPDRSTSLSQIESPRHDSIFINKSKNHVNTEINEKNYIIQPIDDLPDVRSVYRDHEHLWKFYVDLDRFKKGLLHHDYDYVINILKNYAEKQDESLLFVRSCCNILRTEVKRSEYHLRNIIRRTVQMGTFDILDKILFDIGLDILTNLVDNEAWELALSLIQTLNIHDLPCNAEYFLLSAEIYLANKKAIKACDLLKYKNIIRTSRDKWFVKSTINDERIRSKIMYILLDSFCNKFVEHAFFLFQFLLKDQSSQYYPIDLSRYVDKLIMLSLSKKDTNLIIEMANLVLKYTFALSTTTCRALISTLIHMDENLARQIFNYAEGIGIYPAVKLWPVTYIIINTDLTEEEIYLTFLQLLKHLIINFGHAIEFAKPHQIKVYLILEIKLINEQFCIELQNYNNNKDIMNIKALVRNVLKQRFDPPILLMPGSKGRIYKLQSKSVINYLKTEHCN